MPITSLSAWRALLPSALQLDIQSTSSIPSAASYIGSLYDIIGSATPSTNETCDETHSANLLNRASSPSGKNLRLVHLLHCNDGIVALSDASNMIIVFDRLAQTAGLSGGAGGEQTTNLPGSLPSRASSGVGVCAFLRIWSAIGTSGTTFTCRVLGADDVEYTTPAQEIRSTQGAGQMIPIPWPAGVTGIKEVRGFTPAGSTGTAGNIGIIYAKPLIQFPVTAKADLTEDFCWTGLNGFPHVHDNACVGWAPWVVVGNRPIAVNAALKFNHVSN